MLREHVVSEAMHALGIPTTRALAVVATGEPVAREVMLPGAVLARVASSHLRVGTFQYASAHGDTDGAAAARRPRHRAPPPGGGRRRRNPYVALFEAVLEAQAALVARWMLVGFVHGVMNTDNMTISGETIDYGPCAFMEAYDPATVFSSIDLGGRYAYGNQPRIAHWNLARLGEALLPLFADELEPAVEAANGVLATFAARYERATGSPACATSSASLSADAGDAELAARPPRILEAQRVDMTAAFRALSAAARGDDGPLRGLLTDPAAFDAWAARWRARLDAEGRPAAEVARRWTGSTRATCRATSSSRTR